jgi:hypothetical protein
MVTVSASDSYTIRQLSVRFRQSFLLPASLTAPPCSHVYWNGRWDLGSERTAGGAKLSKLP